MKAPKFRTLADYALGCCDNASSTTNLKLLLQQSGKSDKSQLWIRNVSRWLQRSSRNGSRKWEVMPLTTIHTNTCGTSFNPSWPACQRYYISVSEDSRRTTGIHAETQEGAEDPNYNARTGLQRQQLRPARNDSSSESKFLWKREKFRESKKEVYRRSAKYMCQNVASLKTVVDSDGADNFEANPPFEMIRSMQDLQVFVQDVDPWVQWSLRVKVHHAFALLNSLVTLINDNRDKFRSHASESPPIMSSGVVAMEVLDFLYKYLTSPSQHLRYLALTIYGKYTDHHLHRFESYKLGSILGYFEDQGVYKQFRTWFHKGLEEYVQDHCNDQQKMVRFLERYRTLQSGLAMERAHTGLAPINMTKLYQADALDKFAVPADMAVLHAWCCKVSLKDASKELLFASMMTLGRLEFIHVLPAFVSDWLMRYRDIRESFTLKEIIPCGVYIPRTISRTQPNPLLDDLCKLFEAYCMSRNTQAESLDSVSTLNSTKGSNSADSTELSARELSMVLYLFYNSPYRPSKHFYDMWENEFLHVLELQGLDVSPHEIRPIEIIRVTFGLSTLHGFAPSSRFWKLLSSRIIAMLPKMNPVQLTMLIRGLAVLPPTPSIVSTQDYDDLIRTWHESFAEKPGAFDNICYQACVERVMCSAGLLGMFDHQPLATAFSKVAFKLRISDLVNNLLYFERLGFKKEQDAFRIWDAALCAQLSGNGQLSVKELCTLWQSSVRLDYCFSNELVGHMFARFREQPNSKRDQDILGSAYPLVLLTDFLAHFRFWNDMIQRYWLAMSDRMLSQATISELHHMKAKIETIIEACNKSVHIPDAADASQHLMNADVTNTSEPNPKVVWERLVHQLELTSEVGDVARHLRALRSQVLTISSSEETADPM